MWAGRGGGRNRAQGAPSHLTLLPLAVLGWGFLAITLVSLPSALALLLVPWLGGACGRLLLAFLVALAVGTLCGDALLHLWPHVSTGSPGPPAPELGVPGRGGRGLLQIHPGARLRRSQGAQRAPTQPSPAPGQRPGPPGPASAHSGGHPRPTDPQLAPPLNPPIPPCPPQRWEPPRGTPGSPPSSCL